MTGELGGEERRVVGVVSVGGVGACVAVGFGAVPPAACAPEVVEDEDGVDDASVLVVVEDAVAVVAPSAAASVVEPVTAPPRAFAGLPPEHPPVTSTVNTADAAAPNVPARTARPAARRRKPAGAPARAPTSAGSAAMIASIGPSALVRGRSP
ncbi:MAG: hypothetical protein HOV83_40110 [Catenulispora sp.]|nr:hypothetical protein [Catenulispora sp.]